jgi:hypothetical protein
MRLAQYYGENSTEGLFGSLQRIGEMCKDAKMQLAKIKEKEEMEK